MSDNLTAKQRMFVAEYLIDLNATQAAIRAGYSVKTARQMGEENLSKPDIQGAIQKAMEERAKRTQITQDAVLEKLWKICSDDIKNYLSFKTVKTVVERDDDGKPIIDYKTVVDLKDSDDIDTWNISEVSLGRDGQFKFKTHCKDNALVQVGKHLGMFNDKMELDVKGTLEINVNIVED